MNVAFLTLFQEGQFALWPIASNICHIIEKDAYAFTKRFNRGSFFYLYVGFPSFSDKEKKTPTARAV